MPTDALPDFQTFQAQALAAGFDEVSERQWAAGTTLEEHTHPFSVEALVVQGEMWLGVAGVEQHLRPGQRFSLGLAQPHTERYGPEGATYWAARRHATGAA